MQWGWQIATPVFCRGRVFRPGYTDAKQHNKTTEPCVPSSAYGSVFFPFFDKFEKMQKK
jgi:hypothetical protein